MVMPGRGMALALKETADRTIYQEATMDSAFSRKDASSPAQLQDSPDSAALALAIGGAAALFLVGYVVGAGRWSLFARAGGRLIAGIGTIALRQALDSLASDRA
jgi:hypothetical protein